MRFSTVDLAVVDIPGKSAPRRLVQNSPFLQNVSVEVNLYDHVKPGADHEQIAIARWCHMVHIVEARKGYVADPLERRQLQYQDLGGGAGIQLVADQSAALENIRRIVTGAGFRRALVLQADFPIAVFRLETADQGTFV